MKIVADDMRVACLSQNSAVFGQEQYEICQLIAFDADNLANSIIGGNVRPSSFALRRSDSDLP